MALRIGITGGIACGKSTISNWLKQWGYPVIDADVISRQVMKKNEQAFLPVVSEFSKEILDENGEINRMKLAEMIFTDKEKRNRLNEIVHPIIHKEIERLYQEYQTLGKEMIFFDIPLLFEGEMNIDLDYVVVVAISKELQLKRLVERNGYSTAHALDRIKSQMSVEEKKRHADFVIDNEGSLENTENQLIKVIEILQKSLFSS